MDQFDFIGYMRDCAVRLTDIRHDELQPRFFRISGISQLEELLSSLPQAHTPALLVENNTDGRVGDANRSDNFLDIPYHVFYVILKASINDHDAIQQAKRESKRIGFKILGRMLHDRRHYAHGLVMLNFDSIAYQSVGPLGDHCYGTMFSFTVSNGADLGYHEADWLPEFQPLP